jgi:alpha-D-ribose 1-methylphosphonate 5-triphosphate synthase subunit PhnH
MTFAPCAREDEVLDAQRGFRAMLGALARPGTVLRMPAAPQVAPGVDPRLAQIAHVLLDREVTFATVDAAPLAQYLSTATGSRWVDAETADYVFACGASPLGALARLQVGTPEFPEAGATVVLSVEVLCAAPAGARGMGVVLSGPGIESETGVGIDGLHRENLETFARRNADYPLGIDMFLVSALGDVLGLPRTVRLRFEEPA